MSLSVYLYVGDERVEQCPHCEGTGKLNHGRECAFDANITHNLNSMAEAAGIYRHLWRPEEIGITKAAQLIEPLRKGLELLRSDPQRFMQLNPPNGWGSYDGFVPWVQRYLDACVENPDADVRASR